MAIVGAVTAGPNASAIVVPDNSPIHSVAQLKGKKIAVAQGSSADYHLLTVLNKAHPDGAPTSAWTSVPAR